MNVADLIAALTAVGDHALPVSVEGCDCYGDCNGARVVPETTFLNRVTPAYVLVTRAPD